MSSVIAALSESGLSARRLELEITKSVFLKDSSATLEILHRLRGLGIRISMDDFGTGYSSLSYLSSFPFDKIKIDVSFVRELTSRDLPLPSFARSPGSHGVWASRAQRKASRQTNNLRSSARKAATKYKVISSIDRDPPLRSRAC